MRAALKPMVGALYPIPKTAVFPLLLLIFGSVLVLRALIVADRPWENARQAEPASVPESMRLRRAA